MKTVSILKTTIITAIVVVLFCQSCVYNPFGSKDEPKQQILYVAANDDTGQNWLLKLALPSGELLDRCQTHCQIFELKESSDPNKIIAINRSSYQNDSLCGNVELYNKSKLYYFGEFSKFGYSHSDSTRNIDILHGRDSIYMFENNNHTPTTSWPKLFGEGQLVPDGHFYYGMGTTFNNPSKFYKVDYLTMQPLDSFDVPALPGYVYVDHSIYDAFHNRVFMMGERGFVFDFDDNSFDVAGYYEYKGFALTSDLNTVFVSNPGETFNGFPMYELYHIQFTPKKNLGIYYTNYLINGVYKDLTPLDLSLSKDDKWLVVRTGSYEPALLLFDTEKKKLTEIIRQHGNYNVNAILTNEE